MVWLGELSGDSLANWVWQEREEVGLCLCSFVAGGLGGGRPSQLLLAEIGDTGGETDNGLGLGHVR